jgi:hypothetical protein
VFDSIEILFVQEDVCSTDVLFEASNAACAGDGDHVLMATEEPCQGKLSWRTVLFFRDLAQAIGDRKVFRELFSLETRIAVPPVVGCKVADGAPFSPKHLRNLTLTFWTQSGYVKVTKADRLAPFGIRTALCSPKTAIDVKVVQERMRHARVSNTMDLYTHARMERKRAARSRVADVLFERERTELCPLQIVSAEGFTPA